MAADLLKRISDFLARLPGLPNALRLFPLCPQQPLDGRAASEDL